MPRRTITFVRDPRVVPPALDGLHAAVEQVDITPPVDVNIGGFSVIAQERAVGVFGRLRATAMVLGQGTERLALVCVDLHAGTHYLSEAIAHRLDRQHGLTLERLLLVASHTHSGPGGLYGVGTYDARASSTGGFLRALADATADRIVDAIDRAAGRLASSPAMLGTAQVPVWGVSAHKSFAAFRANGISVRDHENQVRCGRLPPTVPDDTYRAVDPRLSVVWAQSRDGHPLGAIGFFGAHSSSVDPLRGLISPDAFGFAARYAADRLYEDGRFWPVIDGRRTPVRVPTAMACAAGGDAIVTDPDRLPQEMPASVEGDDMLTVSRRIGAVLSRTYVEACLHARHQATADAPLGIVYRERDPAGAEVGRSRLSDEPQTGRVALGASEFGRYFLARARQASGNGLFRSISLDFAWSAAQSCPEGSAHDDDVSGPHWPKVLVSDRGLGALLPKLLRDAIRGPMPALVPLRLARLGSVHLLCVPFEVSVGQWARMERILREEGLDEVLLASVSGGYVSYATTEAEYRVQHYEGSSTLWGRKTGPWLDDQVRHMARGIGDLPAPSFSFRVKERRLAPRGKDVDRPPHDLRFRRSGRLLYASWDERRRDRPPFGVGPRVRIDRRVVRHDGTEHWVPAELGGEVVTDASRGMLLTWKGIGGHLVRWELRWQVPRSWADATVRVVRC